MQHHRDHFRNDMTLATAYTLLLAIAQLTGGAAAFAIEYPMTATSAAVASAGPRKKATITNRPTKLPSSRTPTHSPTKATWWPHGPWIGPAINCTDNRPISYEREFVSPAVDAAIANVSKRMADKVLPVRPHDSAENVFSMNALLYKQP